jgi:hypothetical protein
MLWLEEGCVTTNRNTGLGEAAPDTPRIGYCMYAIAEKFWWRIADVLRSSKKSSQSRTRVVAVMLGSRYGINR